MAELLSPAGNPEKLEAAVRYGADAVYLAGQAFGMRAAAGNFSLEQLENAVAFAHSAGVRVYVTVNTLPRDDEYGELEAYFGHLSEIRPDALIVADPGVLFLARQMLPDIDLHISTQANAVSSAACRAWASLGARRVVLSRELRLSEIRRIRQSLSREVELEAFIHGSMCISYSGRCLLSNYLAGRDANRGMCAQPCRWHYTAGLVTELTEEKRQDERIPVYEEAGETFVMSSRDTCMIGHIPQLLEAGIDSFKIEGRMKSAYYTAVVTNAYRMAIDAAQTGKPYDPAWYRELESVSHRPYHTGYYFDDPHTCANTAETAGYIREKAYLATVLSYDAQSGKALLVQRNKLYAGQPVELLTPGRCGVRFTVGDLTLPDGTAIDATPHPGMQYRMTVPFEVRQGDIIRGGVEEG